MSRTLMFVCLWMAASTCAQADQTSNPPQADVRSPAPPSARASDALADMPLWAYGIATLPQPGDTAKPQGWGRQFNPAMSRDDQLRPVLHVAGSPRTYAPIDLNDWANVVDWFPDEHAPMPEVVQHGSAALGERRRACAFCHRISGGGRPENAPIAGLPVEYFLRQLEDFRSGRRHSTDPRKPNVPTMIEIARAISPDEARAAAEYYAKQSGAPRIRIVESDRVPPLRLRGNLFVATSQERTEPLADRIVELLDGENEQFNDNPHVGYMAYVPRGGIERGRALVAAGTSGAPAAAGTTAQPCTACHGTELHGLGPAPPLAGRSPSYLVRQLYDFKTGSRVGSLAPLMKPVASRLTTQQMTDIAAYIASLP
ncbi:MAG: c-type cytochrome [Proteobacteria bacterium]|nr:c-type cytochrome [Pseudomonadota bacterium]